MQYLENYQNKKTPLKKHTTKHPPSAKMRNLKVRDDTPMHLLEAYERNVELKREHKLPAITWREVLWGLILIFPILAIHICQLLSLVLYIYRPAYNKAQEFWKGCFAELLIFFVERCAKKDLNKVQVSGSQEALKDISLNAAGELQFNFDDRSVFLSNHQIYTDWIYLWWVAYLNGSHDVLYIILKESVKYIPILGWGSYLFSFIFLARDMKKDRSNIERRINKMNATKRSTTLIFPEGTTNTIGAQINKDSIIKEKTQIEFPMLNNLLLPRPGGSQILISNIKDLRSVYVCTIGYSKAPKGMVRQDYFTIRRMIATGEVPAVYMYFDKIDIKDIPKGDAKEDTKAFTNWMNSTWTDVDKRIGDFEENGVFKPNSHSDKPAYFETSIKLRGYGRLFTGLAAAFAITVGVPLAIGLSCGLAL